MSDNLRKVQPSETGMCVDGRVAGHLGAADGLKTSSIHVCICPYFGMKPPLTHPVTPPTHLAKAPPPTWPDSPPTQLDPPPTQPDPPPTQPNPTHPARPPPIHSSPHVDGWNGGKLH